MTEKSKNIAIFHYQVGHTDGVSLEIDKWKRVFEEMGHHVTLCAGELGTTPGTLIREMYHHIPEIKLLNRNTFVRLQDIDAAGYASELARWKDILVRGLRNFLREKEISLLVSQNIWCVAANPPLAVALEQVRREFNLPAMAHHHDFYWERTSGVALTCAEAIELADKYLPPRDPSIQHVVINSLAQRELQARKGIPSTVVPNVFDFDAPPWEIDAFNHDLRERIGLKENDLMILQATRIVQRKGIEMAIDFVQALNSPSRRADMEQRGLYDGRKFSKDSRIVLVLAGYTLDDITGSYLNLLKSKARRSGVEMIHIGEIVGHERGERFKQKIYSLWDTYAHADFVTYPSLWEGWGNQFLEAVRACLPIVIYDYPVYRSDIKDKGFQTVSLGSEINGRDDLGLAVAPRDKVEAAADQTVRLLTHAGERAQFVEHNFKIGQEYYSMEALHNYLNPLVNQV
jgi:glycosyltransferase involved in cell wall biosynthesis